jgi:hypothetical protein
MSEDPIITIADFRRVYCVSGTYSRMVSAGVDFRAFVQNGLPLSQLKGRGYDALIDRIVDAKCAAEAKSVTIPQVDQTHGR